MCLSHACESCGFTEEKGNSAQNLLIEGKFLVDDRNANDNVKTYLEKLSVKLSKEVIELMMN